MSIVIGIAGKPNIGKSTFFKAATMANVDIGNYPFTTINPNYGIAYIQTLCPCVNTQKKCNFCIDGIRYIQINLIDIAGLVPDAHLGKGLGNKFLDDLSKADLIIHVVDSSGSTDIEGNPLAVGSHDPLDDINFLNKEIELWIYEIIKKNWNKIIKKIKNEHLSISEVFANQLSGAGVKMNHVEDVINNLQYNSIDISNWDNSIIQNFCHNIKLKSRPMVIVGNKIDKATEENIKKLKNSCNPIYFTSSEAELILKLANKNGYIFYVPGSNKFSIIKKEKLSKDQIDVLNKISLLLLKYEKGTGVQYCLNSIVFDILNMIVVYPVEDEHKLCDKNGTLLPTAFLMKQGSTCYDLAKKIHTDISSTILYAVDCRKNKRISEKYILKNNDIIKIIFSANKH